jgi:hypothetical protein
MAERDSGGDIGLVSGFGEGVKDMKSTGRDSMEGQAGTTRREG